MERQSRWKDISLITGKMPIVEQEGGGSVLAALVATCMASYILIQMIPVELCFPIIIVYLLIMGWLVSSGNKITAENEELRAKRSEAAKKGAATRKKNRIAKKRSEGAKRFAEKERKEKEESKRNTPRVIESINKWPDIDEAHNLGFFFMDSLVVDSSMVLKSIEKRQGELSIIEKNAKVNAFAKQNFQKGHNSPNIRQKEKKWQESRLIWKMSKFDFFPTISTIKCNICSNHICNSELTFWWRIFPEVELNLLCEECAIREDLVEKIPETELSSRNIPRDVKDSVWNRDGGRCVGCGSNKNLEFDHIIPHSKGGSNTYRNIQLLCESCNRTKSDKIG